MRVSTGTGNRFGFTGEPTDATTGNLDLRARYHNPSTGRFLSTDIVQPNAPGTQGFNRYAYVANNPMRYTDPTGHTISDVEQGMEILAGLVDSLIAVGEVIQAMLPIMLLGGFIGLALGLFFILILSIMAAMFYVIGQILQLLTDEFDHYENDAPEEGGSSNDPDELPQEPDEDCPIQGSVFSDCDAEPDDCDSCFMDCCITLMDAQFEFAKKRIKPSLKGLRALAGIRGPGGIGASEVLTMLVIIAAIGCFSSASPYKATCMSGLRNIVLGGAGTSIGGTIAACSAYCLQKGCYV